MANLSVIFGPLLVGALTAAAFTGILAAQCFSYVKNYSDDYLLIKILVAVIWLLDLGHMILVGASLWDYFIVYFGDPDSVDHIPRSLALTITFTAILTFLVHCFQVHRIYKLSNSRYLLSLPLTLLAVLRLGVAFVTTVKMITLQSFTKFIQESRWSFTMGLALSAILDVLITSFLCWLLFDSHKQTSSLNHILDSLMLYTFENGALTCAISVASMLCWLIMPTNLIFMGLHFVISKCYANSLLATLNTRKGFRTDCQPQLSLQDISRLNSYTPPPPPLTRRRRPRGIIDLLVDVEKTTQYHTEAGSDTLTHI